jgi:hypothetical protein
MKQPTHRITVVSEGLLFEGYRAPCAFVWREAATIPLQPVRPPKATAPLVEYVLDCVRTANLSKEDKAKCRRQVSGMTGAQVQELSKELRRFLRSSFSQ